VVSYFLPSLSSSQLNHGIASWMSEYPVVQVTYCAFPSTTSPTNNLKPTRHRNYSQVHSLSLQMCKHLPSCESDGTPSDCLYTDTTKPSNTLKWLASYSLSISTDDMTSVQAIDSSTCVSAATWISSVQPPAELSAAPVSPSASMFNNDTQPAQTKGFLKIAQEFPHGSVVADYHRKRGNLHELLNCLVEIEKSSAREHVLTADGRTRALVG
jgi:hypothetical protein